MKKNVKRAIFGAAGVLAAANCVKAALHNPDKVDYGEFPCESVNEARALANLSEAIRIPTISNPDKSLVDWSQFEKFRDFLDKSYPLITEKLEKEIITEASIIYRWKGKNPELLPIALLSHQDVVPVSEGTESDWVHPPFSGFNDGEFIWGRGALDMKNHLVCVMEAVETLLEEGFEPECDVYLLFGHDEEVVASDYAGAKSIMETLQSRGIRLDSVIDEGGAILPVNVKGIINKKLAGIGIAEKGYADIQVSVNHRGGHSSQPPKHTGLGLLADVIKDLEKNQFDSKMEPFLFDLFDKIGRSVSYPAKLITCNLPLLKPLVLEILKQIPPAACMVRTTTAATMAQGSPAANVLPQISSVVVNFRHMPGTTTDDIVKHIKKVVRNKDIEIKVLKSKEPSKFSPTDSRSFKVIEKLCMQSNPDSIVAPYLVMGGTDASFYEPICDNIYRFAPFVVSTELLLCTHSTNERIPVTAMKEGVEFFKAYIRQLSSN
ncbi:MAG: M20/M25/M40 family metallo-hydrolase [Clostridiales bacterium]|jgi:carboxypeptidase PM20D1|nr:M20/M25/M40 family metallo-hydrolase [Clostridiales bacterium]